MDVIVAEDAAQGEPPLGSGGDIEFGYWLEPDGKIWNLTPKEHPDIRAMCAQGLFMRAIATELNERGNTTRRDTRWRLSRWPS